MQFERITVFCFFASYAIALAFELTQFLRRSQLLRWGSLIFTSAGLIAHTVYLISRSRQHDLPPLLGSTHDWLLVSAWLAVVLYLGIQLWNRQLSLGIFCFPIVLTLIGASKFVSNSPNPRIELYYWWSMVHASFWVFGILGVMLALMVSVMYLIQHSRLKHKQSELPALQMFSLERLSRMNWWLIIFSVPCLTLGLVTGLWMTYLNKSAEHPVNLVSFAFAANAAIWVGMALLFGWLLAAKHPTGKIVAWRTALACLFLLTTLLVIQLMSVDVIHGRDSSSATSTSL